MLNITIKTIPHEHQRYPTVGDWFFKAGKLSKITVSDMANDDYEFLVGIHEAIEAYLCAKKGITEKQVNAFDEKYEECRATGEALPCGCAMDDEPGFDKHAPYKKEHAFATAIEKQLSTKLEVNWMTYNDTVNEL